MEVGRWKMEDGRRKSEVGRQKNRRKTKWLPHKKQANVQKKIDILKAV
jgi:hypothetical protein